MTRRWCLPLAALMLTTGTLAAAAPAPAAAPPPAAGPWARIGIHHSLNWAGYAEHYASLYTSVSADWVQPTVRCGGGGAQVAFFAALDGYANGFFNMTGTQVKCSKGIPAYTGFAAIYPKRSTFTNVLLPGDQMTASVTYTGTTGDVSTVLTDATQGWTQSFAGPDAPPASAEVITDDPSYPNGIALLANFGTVEFTNITANGQEMPNATRFVMVRDSGAGLKAAITPLLGRTHFSVTWRHRN